MADLCQAMHNLVHRLLLHIGVMLVGSTIDHSVSRHKCLQPAMGSGRAL